MMVITSHSPANKNLLGKHTAGELHDNAEAKSITPNGAESSRLVVSNNEMATFQNPQRKLGATAVPEREQALFGNGFSFDQAANPYGPNDVIAQGFKFPNPVDA